MVVKTVEYSKTFLSKTIEVDVGHHKSEWAEAQGLSEDDENIRREVEHKFGFEMRHDAGGGYWNKDIFGSDRKFLYSFRISGHPPQKEDEKESLKSIPYQTEVHIRKSGSIIDLNCNDLSDLERFLIEKEFQKK